jgi:hypothetical protein
MFEDVPPGQVDATSAVLEQALQAPHIDDPAFVHLVRSCALAVERQQKALGKKLSW